MEWFITAHANLPASELQRHVRVDNLGEWCPDPPAIDTEAAQRAASGWATVGVHREVIRDGLRFTLPGSAGAVQWTLTAGAQARSGTVNVHCTLNTPAAEAATVAALERFMAEWRSGLESGARRLQQLRAEKNAECIECPPWFG